MHIAGRYTFEIDVVDMHLLEVTTTIGRGAEVRVIYDAEHLKGEHFLQFAKDVEATETADGTIYQVRILHSRSRNESVCSDFAGHFLARSRPVRHSLSA